jgi:hypothetical protein
MLLYPVLEELVPRQEDWLEFPTPSEAYLKKPPVSDADAVKMAKMGAKKK